MSNCLNNNYVCYAELHYKAFDYKAFDEMLESLRKNKGWIAACGKNHTL